MNALQQPIAINENSFRVNQLQVSLQALGFPVAASEIGSHTAGPDTLRQVRAFQQQANIPPNNSVLADAATLAAMAAQLKAKQVTTQSNSFTVTGTVFDTTGQVAKRQSVIALNIDLKGAATFRTITSLQAAMKSGGFEYLGEAVTDPEGVYSIKFYNYQYTTPLPTVAGAVLATRNKADVVVYAVNGDTILGRSDMINTDGYATQGVATNLNVLITGKRTATQYSQLMDGVNTSLRASNVTLINLAASADQVRFLAGDLDESETNIRLAANAESLRSDKGAALSHELLYGIGKQDIELNWLVLYRKTKDQLQQAIQQSVNAGIIQPIPQATIDSQYTLIQQLAASYVLTYKDKNQTVSLSDMLSSALPDTAHQQAFVTAVNSFQGDFKDFWTKYLPSQAAFKDNPQLINNLLFSQQLTVISGNHQPLIKEIQGTQKINSVTPLLDLDAAGWKTILTKTGTPDYVQGNTPDEKIANYTAQLTDILNAAYPTQKIASMLAAGKLPLKDSSTSAGIGAFLKSTPAFDIGSSPISQFDKQINTASPQNAAAVKTELKRVQRIFQVSPNPQAMSTLMSRNLDSAYAINSMPQKTFLKMHGDALGGEDIATAVYQRANYITTQASERAMKMYDVSHSAAPQYALSQGDQQAAMTVLSNQVPNYSDLFGSPDICECDDCKSVYSASAYFIDLLRFLWRGVKNADVSVAFPQGKSPLDKFTERRPDLLFLPLTCENTNTLIPYIDLVNEVMEYYTYHNQLDSNAAYDTGDTPAEELRATPQNFVLEAYRTIKNTVFPFSLPYHQPLDVIRTFSDHLNTPRYDVMKGLQKDFSATTVLAIQSEALRISEEEFTVLTLKKFDGTPDTRLLYQYFGYAAPADMEKMAGVGIPDGIHEFLRRAGLEYTDLVDLISTRFINPYQYLLDFVEQLFVDSTVDAGTLYSKFQQIKAGTLDPSTDTDIMAALNPAHITAADFTTWVKNNLDNFNKVITLYQSDSMCDLNTTYLRTLGNVYAGSTASGITDDGWSKMHRFIRLWRKLKWTIHEVDLMLFALGESDIADTTIAKLSFAVQLNKQLKWPLNQLATLWGNIDTYGTQSLYKKLFLNKAVLQTDNVFAADVFGNFLTDGTQVLGKHLPAILSAFRLSEDDLTAILSFATVIDGGTPRALNTATDILNISNLSTIYRYTVLSKALKQKAPDFVLLLQLFGAAPFSVYDIQGGHFTSISPSATYDLYQLATSVKLSGFKAATLQYIFQGTLPAESTLALDTDKIKLAASAVRGSFDAIEQDYPDRPALPLTADLLGSMLALSYTNDVVTTLAGLVSFRQTFSVVTDTGLPVTIPAGLVPKYSYTGGSGLLSCIGAMTLAESAQLKALAGATAAFTAAVDTLYNLSRAPQAGSPVFTILTDANLGVIIPEALTPKYSYIKASGRLTCTGVMSDPDRIALKAIPGANANFNAAVDALYKMPEDFLANNFSGLFPVMNTALATLLDHPAQPSEPTLDQKMNLVYDSYVPLLKQKLHKDAITQHIAALIGLTEDSTTSLVQNDLQTIINQLSTEGFSADYFSDANWGTLVLQRTDATIDFDWGTGSPGAAVPADNFSVRWQSYIAPPSTGDYTLQVDVQEADEKFNLYLDDALILQKTSGDVRLSWQALATLNASQLHRLVLEYADISQKAGVVLSWKTATTALEVIPVSAAFPAAVIDQFIQQSILYHRASKFITGFQLNDREMAHLVQYNANFGGIHFKPVSPAQWLLIRDYTTVRNAAPETQATLTDVFAAANLVSPAPTLPALINLLCLATAWDPDTITYLATTYFALGVNDFKNQVALLRLSTAAGFVRKTGIAAVALAQWAVPETDFDKLNTTAELVRSTVKAKYEDADWLTLSGNLSDKLRGHQRDALVAYLLTRPELIKWGVQDADGLFEYFLIDVQMGSCMDTSRIVQASAAVQQFVNRCFLNLESDLSSGSQKGVAPDALDADRWQWMEYYQVWVVNRKIFLYPENWLEPEWRDDKSVFFADLESELVQNDITAANVETAFRNYLTSLNSVANLDVCGVYQENDTGGNILNFHVFGRTHNSPYSFFYRTWDKYRKWSAWDKVPIDIRMTEDGDNSGVHLCPVVWKSRLTIFWLEFIKKNTAPANNNNQSIQDMGTNNTPGQLQPQPYYEVRLGFSEYKDSKWNPKQLSKEFLTLGGIDHIGEYTLNAYINASTNELTLSVYNSWQDWLGSFLLTDIQSRVTMIEGSIYGDSIYQPVYTNDYMKHYRAAALTLKNHTYLKTTVAHDLLYSPQITDFDSTLNYPFFYEDHKRTYFVRPVDITVVEYVKNPNYYGPAMTQLVDNSYYTTYHPPVPDPGDYLPTINTDRAAIDIPPMVLPNRIGQVGVQNPGAGLRTAVAARTAAPAPAHLELAPGRGGAQVVIDAYSNKNSYLQKAFGGIDGKWGWGGILVMTKGLEFNTFYHPYSSQFITRLNQGGLDNLLSSDTVLAPDSGTTFTNGYNPDFPSYVQKAPASDDYTPSQAYTFYKENVCFDVFGANSCYNWELFLHAPLYIANRLSKNGQYQDAMTWYQYIFDPTTDELPLVGQSETSRYWKVLPFKTTPADSLLDWFMSLPANTDPSASAENQVIGEWRDNPFKPFVIARNRPLAFMKNVVMKYVDNLLAWGDSLFRNFTRENVYEALQLYVIANHILGPRPQLVPKRGDIKAETYDSLKDKWDDFSNALVELENVFPYSSSIPASSGSSTTSLLGIGQSLYFCLPNNDQLLQQWDTVADRLYKIRHCMDIDGVQRQLALFAPPIDPAALINAAAQGLSLGSILADLSSPPPIYRFTHLIQKANDFCLEVKSLGNSLLAALEKKDNEELSRLRASHEVTLLNLMTAIKERQVLDAEAAKDALLKSRDTAKFRLDHYNGLIQSTTVTVPDPPALPATLDADSQLPADTNITVTDTGVDTSLVDSGESGVSLISKEKQELDLSLASMILQQIATATEGVAGTMNLIPTISAAAEPLGCGVTASFGGSNIAGAISGFAKIPQGVATLLTFMATQSSKMAGYIRREQEWFLQASLAAKEIIQLDKQITSADIKIQIAQTELSNHLTQIDNATEIQTFLLNKFTGKELYQWMKEQLFAVYKQAYNMAYDMAKKVEKCYQYELGLDTTNFIQYGYWDNARQGLCAGENLQLALKQLEKSYLEENKRELELAKNVSLAFLDPLALQELRTTGKCFISIPEALFDLDYQGHYFRRIKSVTLSIPCVAGPYTTVSCTLRLLKNSIRINTAMNDDGNYEHNNDEGVWTDDDRFRENNVGVKAIAASTAQHDSGMFELNFRDERYLPFEGAGAVSDWKIELTQDADLRLFDYSTISDVIVLVRYTAREDVGPFRDKVVSYLKAFLSNAAELSEQPLRRMFSLRHEFSTEWYKFLFPAVAGADQLLSLQLRKEHFPFFTQDKAIDVRQLVVMIQSKKTGDYKMMLTASDTGGDPLVSTEISMPGNPSYGNMQMTTLAGTMAGVDVESLDIYSPITLKFKSNTAVDYHSNATNPEDIEDIFVVVNYALGAV